VISGAVVGLALAALRVPVLPVAIGFYLPIYLVGPIMMGGALRGFIEFRLKNTRDEGARIGKIESGILYSSGLIAGEGLVGILLAVLTVLGVNISLTGENGSVLGNISSCAAFALLALSLLKLSLWQKGGASR
jgi:uncharacterized oligopeptide transporter (OPT) family protein